MHVLSHMLRHAVYISSRLLVGHHGLHLHHATCKTPLVTSLPIIIGYRLLHDIVRGNFDGSNQLPAGW